MTVSFQVKSGRPKVRYYVVPKNYVDFDNGYWTTHSHGKKVWHSRGDYPLVFATEKEAIKKAEELLPKCQAVFIETYPCSDELKILNKQGVWKTVTLTKRPPRPEFKYK
jgi:hypothetical protein